MSDSSGIGEFINDLLPEIVAFGRAAAMPEWACGTAILAHHVLLYAGNAGGTVTVDGLQERLEEDSLFLYPPGTLLRIATENDKEQVSWLCFDLYRETVRTDRSLSLERELSLPLRGRVQLARQRERLDGLIARLEMERSASPKRLSLLARHELVEALGDLSAYAGTAEKADMNGRVQQTVRYMQHHYPEAIKMDKLAAMARLHPAYYTHAFKHTMNKTPVTYLTQLRMNKAKELLLTTERPVREIASEVGYADEFYFSRRFKETSGQAPTIYMKRDDFSVISLSAPYTDHLFTLGMRPGAAQIPAYLPLAAKPLNLPKHRSEPWQIDRDTFLEARPDLIICKDNVLEKAQEHINDIAPIVAIPWASKDVYTHLLDIAELVNRKAEAVRWLDGHERIAEQASREVSRTTGGRTAVICVVKEGKLRIYSSRNIGHVLYRLLGLCPPELVMEQMKQHGPGVGHNWTAIEPHEMTRYPADYLFLVPKSGADATTARTACPRFRLASAPGSSRRARTFSGMGQVDRICSIFNWKAA
jgi:AraC-like DNA-binding protein